MPNELRFDVIQEEDNRLTNDANIRGQELTPRQREYLRDAILDALRESNYQPEDFISIFRSVIGANTPSNMELVSTEQVDDNHVRIDMIDRGNYETPNTALQGQYVSYPPEVHELVGVQPMTGHSDSIIPLGIPNDRNSEIINRTYREGIKEAGRLKKSHESFEKIVNEVVENFENGQSQ